MKQPSISPRSPIRANMQGASLAVSVSTPDAMLFAGEAGQVTFGEIKILPNQEGGWLELGEGIVSIGKESFALTGA